MELAEQHCVPCRGGVPPLQTDRIRALHAQLGEAWEVIDEHHLKREVTFPDFAEGLVFVNRVGAMAEEQGHHPDITLAWGRVRIEVWTHKVDGLTESDFIFAAKAEQLLDTD